MWDPLGFTLLMRSLGPVQGVPPGFASWKIQVKGSKNTGYKVQRPSPQGCSGFRIWHSGEIHSLVCSLSVAVGSAIYYTGFDN